MQLATRGVGLELFTSDVENTFWKYVSRRHTLFAIESIQCSFQNDVAFDSQSTCVIARQGDLLCGLMLQVTLTKLDNRYPNAQAAYYPVEALVRDVVLTIGGEVVDRHTSDWFRIYDSLIRDAEQSLHYQRMANFDATTLTTELQSTETLYLPLSFSFTRHPGLALPLIAMYDSEIKLTFTFATAAEVGVAETGFTAAVYGEYVYLDSTERAHMLNRPHDLLIEQVQINGGYSIQAPQPAALTTVTCPLQFFRPIKCLYWCLKETRPPPTGRTNHGRYVGDAENTYLALQPSQYGLNGFGLYETISEKLAPVHSAHLVIGGVDRAAPRIGRYYNLVQPYQYGKRAPMPGVYMYSFALNPEAIAPSGEADFSTIGDVKLILKLKKTSTMPLTDVTYAGEGAETTARNIVGMTDLLVFAAGYNYLHIEGGVTQMLLGDGS